MVWSGLKWFWSGLKWFWSGFEVVWSGFEVAWSGFEVVLKWFEVVWSGLKWIGVRGFSGFSWIFVIFDFLWGFWGPGGIPLDSERNFDPCWGRETPGAFFWTRFGLFFSICWMILQALLWGVHPPGGHFFEKMHLLDFTSSTMGCPPSGGSFFSKMTPFGNNLSRQKWRAPKFHAESTSYHAEINFLGLFREHRGFLFFCFSPPSQIAPATTNHYKPLQTQKRQTSKLIKGSMITYIRPVLIARRQP